MSTTHSIIGGILGVGLILEVKYSTSLIDWEVVRKVVMSWVASPLMGGLIGFFSFVIIKKLILDNDNPVERSSGLPQYCFPDVFRSWSGTAVQSPQGVHFQGGLQRLD